MIIKFYSTLRVTINDDHQKSAEYSCHVHNIHLNIHWSLWILETHAKLQVDLDPLMTTDLTDEAAQVISMNHILEFNFL